MAAKQTFGGIVIELDAAPHGFGLLAWYYWKKYNEWVWIGNTSAFRLSLP